MKLLKPVLEHVCTLTVELGPIREMGQGRAGARRIIPIIGGTVADDGAVIEIINYGYRDGTPEVLAALGRGEAVPPEDYYMRTHARLETGDARYDWVNRTLFVGTGARNKSSVNVDLYALR